MNLDKKNQLYLLTGVFFVLLLISVGISPGFGVLLCIIVALGFHSLMCYKFGEDTNLNIYIKRICKKLKNRNE